MNSDRDQTEVPIRFRGEELLRGPRVLRGFASAAGRLDPVGSGLYKTGALVLRGSPHLYLFADAVSVGDRDEVFPLGCREFDEGRDWSRPGFMPVEPVPSDLPLADFLEVPLRTFILTTQERYYIRDTPEQTPVDSGVLFESPSGRRLLVESRHDPVADGTSPVAPLDLTLASEQGLISERLARGELRSVQG
jgi:hypothetical protein